MRYLWQMDEEARKHLQLTLEGKERPVPAFFTKYITGTYGKDSFAYCRAGENSKWFAGAELALIMGRMARRLSEEEALDYVAGIAVGQDFAERDWDTNESRWLYGKAYDAPIGLGLAAALMLAP
jgi:acylpyruvate hydrolase